MDTGQQQDALSYFKEHAGDWKRKADSSSTVKVNVIRQRNDCVLKVIDERKNTAFALDVGCGTGELVCEIAARGIEAVGIDFAREMIEIAERKAREGGLEKARFVCSSIFDYPAEPSSFDVISANGFIEYISYEELDQFLELSLKALREGGALVVGSRNRLFNLFSMNRYTMDELKSGAAEALLGEAVAVAGAGSVGDLEGVETAGLQPPDIQHQDTGIEVRTRFQFTPVQLLNMVREKGFRPAEIFPVHFHAVPPGFKKDHPDVHTSISDLLQQVGGGAMALVPQASTFMLHARK